DCQRYPATRRRTRCVGVSVRLRLRGRGVCRRVGRRPTDVGVIVRGSVGGGEYRPRLALTIFADDNRANTVRPTLSRRRKALRRKAIEQTKALTENPCVGGSIPPLTTCEKPGFSGLFLF